MVTLNSPFCKHCQFHLTIRQILYSCKKYCWYMTSVYLAKSVLSMEINDIVERHGTQQRLRRVTCTCLYYTT